MIEKAYIMLRQFLGWLGIALPVLVLGFGFLGDNGPGWYYSISASAYTNAAPIFYGTMVAVGAFFMAYGVCSLGVYSPLDAIVNSASGVFALLIAFFSCFQAGIERAGIYPVSIGTSALIHNVSASVFFMLLAFNILFLFTKGTASPTKEKIWRNRVYRVCGIGIVAFMAAQVVTSVLALDGPYTMVNEAGMLWCFGAAWLVKGETLLADKS